MEFGILLSSSLQFKSAASQAIMSLRNPRSQKYLGGDLFFGKEMAQLNTDAENFAVFDRKNIHAIQDAYENNTGANFSNKQEVAKIYLEHPKTQELINFIIVSYNKYFPKLSGERVYEHLKNEGLDYETTGFVSETPIFILIHDLIHQVIESGFVTTLENQDEIGITLMDEINEDMASTFSGFSPEKPFLPRYLERTFLSFLRKNEGLPGTRENHFVDELKQIIEKTFHQAKAELRGKINTIAENLSKEYVDKARLNLASGKIKQFFDGVLSKYKHEMMISIPYALEAIEGGDIGYNKTYSSLFQAFELGSLNERYQEDLQKSDLIPQIEASSLRAWVLECLRKMKEINNYFQNQLEGELISEYQNDEDYE